MSDYSRQVDFTTKDGLSPGNADKLIKGVDFDSEFDAILTAVNSKYDSADLASKEQAELETANTVLITPLRLANWADANDGLVGDIQALTGLGTGGDKLLGFDDTSDTAIAFSLGTGITSSGTSITTDDSAIVHDNLSGFVGAEHVNHSSVSITAGTGLSGGGDIQATRTLNLSHLGIESLVDPNADRILFWDDGAGATAWLSVSTGLTLSGTTLTTNDGAIVHDSLSGFVAAEHVNHTSVTVVAGGADGLTQSNNDLSSNIGLKVDISGTTAYGDTTAVDLDVDTLLMDDGDGGTLRNIKAASLVQPEIGTTVTGTSDTLAESDFGKLTRYSSTSTVTITLPNGLKTGFWAVLQKTGASGTINLSASGTLNTENSATSITAQHGVVTVLHLGSNVWTAWGSLV